MPHLFTLTPLWNTYKEFKWTAIKCKVGINSRTFDLLHLSWNNKRTDHSWTWNCLVGNCPTTFEPLKMRDYMCYMFYKRWTKYYMLSFQTNWWEITVRKCCDVSAHHIYTGRKWCIYSARLVDQEKMMFYHSRTTNEKCGLTLPCVQGWQYHITLLVGTQWPWKSISLYWVQVDRCRPRSNFVGISDLNLIWIVMGSQWRSVDSGVTFALWDWSKIRHITVIWTMCFSVHEGILEGHCRS